MSVPTKEIALPSGGKAELLEYVTAGIIIDLKAIDNEIDGTKHLLENLVKSVNGIKENIYQTVRNLRLEDYQKIDTEISKLIVSDDEKKK